MLTPIDNLFNRPIAPSFLEPDPYKTFVNEEKSKFIIETALPGLDREDISVKIGKNVLHITAQNKSESTRRQISYNRSYSLPSNLDIDNISAHYDKGILTVEIPKTEQPKTEAKEVKIS